MRAELDRYARKELQWSPAPRAGRDEAETGIFDNLGVLQWSPAPRAGRDQALDVDLAVEGVASMEPCPEGREGPRTRSTASRS